jgi:chromosome segregation ATPase
VREKLAQIRQGLEETEKERAEIQGQIKEAKAATDKIRRSQQEIRQKQFYFSGLTHEEQEKLDRMVQSLAKLYEDADEVNTQLLEELKEANEKISKLEIELYNVKKELEIERRRGDSLQKDVDDLEKEVASLEEIVAALVTKLDETEAELARCKEDVDETHAPVSPRRHPSSQVTKQGLSTEELRSGESSREGSQGQVGNRQIEGTIERQQQNVPLVKTFSGSSSGPSYQKKDGKPRTEFFIVRRRVH